MYLGAHAVFRGHLPCAGPGTGKLTDAPGGPDSAPGAHRPTLASVSGHCRGIYEKYRTSLGKVGAGAQS